jgi:hypothetical protein
MSIIQELGTFLAREAESATPAEGPRRTVRRR